MDVLDDAIVPPKLKDHSVEASQNSPPYTIGYIPNKGKGLIAQRQIRKWEVVFVDYPSLLVHLDVFDVVDAEARQDLLERALHQLPEHQRDVALALARSTGGEPIEDIMRTNIFGVEMGSDIQHLGLLPIGSVS